LRLKKSILWSAGGPPGDRDWNGETDPHEEFIIGGVQNADDNANHLAITVEQRPTGVARVYR
jgi:hypothetical protein